MVRERALHALEQVMASIKIDEDERKKQVDIVEKVLSNVLYHACHVVGLIEIKFFRFSLSLSRSTWY